MTLPPFGTQYSGFLDGMKYAKDQYTVHNNPVILYTDIFLFSLKRSNFIKKHNKPDIVVNHYAVQEAKKWWYSIRKAKIGWYAVRKG